MKNKKLKKLIMWISVVTATVIMPLQIVTTADHSFAESSETATQTEQLAVSSGGGGAGTSSSSVGAGASSGTSSSSAGTGTSFGTSSSDAGTGTTSGVSSTSAGTGTSFGTSSSDAGTGTTSGVSSTSAGTGTSSGVSSSDAGTGTSSDVSSSSAGTGMPSNENGTTPASGDAESSNTTGSTVPVSDVAESLTKKVEEADAETSGENEIREPQTVSDSAVNENAEDTDAKTESVEESSNSGDPAPEIQLSEDGTDETTSTSEIREATSEDELTSDTNVDPETLNAEEITKTDVTEDTASVDENPELAETEDDTLTDENPEPEAVISLLGTDVGVKYDNSTNDIKIEVNGKVVLEITLDGFLRVIATRIWSQNGAEYSETTDTIYERSSEIANIVIASTEDTVSLGKAENTTLDLSNAAVTISAKKKILLDASEETDRIVMKVKSLELQAAKVTEADGKSISDSWDDLIKAGAAPIRAQNIEIIINNVDIKASEGVTIHAQQTARQEGTQKKEDALNGHSEDSIGVVDGEVTGNTWTEMLNKYKLMFQVDTADTVIKITNSNINAENGSIKITADNTVEMATYGFFFAANWAWNNSTVEINEAVLNAKEDIIVEAKAYVKSRAKRISSVGGAFGLTASVITGNTKVDVMGSKTELNAGRDIRLSASTTIDSKANQDAGRYDDTESGGIAAFTILDYDTAAKVSGYAKLSAVRNIDVLSLSNSASGTTAIMSAYSGTEGVLGKNNELQFRALDAANAVSLAFTNQTVVGNGVSYAGKQLSPAITTIKEKITQLLGLGGDDEHPAEAGTQYAGSLAISYANVTNNAVLNTLGTVNAGAALNVMANASTDASVEANSATMETAKDFAQSGHVYAQLVCGSTAVPTEFTLVNGIAASLYLNTIPSTAGEEVDFGETVQSRLGVGRYFLTFTVDTSTYKVKGLDDPDQDIKELYYTIGSDGKVMTTYRMTFYLLPAAPAYNEDDKESSPADVVMTTIGKRIKIELEKNNEEQKPVPNDSKGISIAAAITKGENKAYITNNGSVTAAKITVQASDALKSEKDDDGKTKLTAIASNSAVKAVSGVSTGNVGLTGALAINYHDVTTEAYIEKTELYIKDNGTLTIKANATLKSGTTANGKVKEKEAGTGVAIAAGYATYTTKARLAGDVNILGTCSELTVSSNANVKEAKVNTKTGSKADGLKNAQLIGNILKINTVAEIPTETTGGALSLANCDITVSAKTTANQKSRGEGASTNGKSAYGASIGVDWANINTTAALSRTIEKSNNITVKAVGDITDDLYMISTAAGAPKSTDNNQAADAQANNAIENLVGAEDANVQMDAAGEKFGLAAAIAVGLRTQNTTAKIEGTTTSTGELSIEAIHIDDISVTANGGATLQDKGVGAAGSYLDSDTIVNATVSGEHTAGSFTVAAEMPEKEEKDRKDEDDKYESSSIKVTAYAGAGASNVGIAGSGAFNFATADYNATVEGKLTAVNENKSSCINALALRDVETTASGSADQNGLVSEDDDDENAVDTSKGIGAAFSVDHGHVNANALVKNGAIVVTAGDLDISSSIANDISTTAEAGGDVYNEPAIDGAITLKFVDGNGKPVAAKAYVVIYKTEGDGWNKPTDIRGGMYYTGKEISFDAQKGMSYYIRLESADESQYKFEGGGTEAGFNIDENTRGYSQTWVLTKEGDPIFYNTAFDVSFAWNYVTSSAIARTEKDSSIKAGNLSVTAESESTSEVNGGSEAQSSNNAVGATTALNLIKEDVKAEILGRVETGDLTVSASAETEDVAETNATAYGVDLDRYERNLNKEIRDKIPHTGKSKVNQQIQNGIDEIGDIGLGEQRPVGEDAPVNEQVLGALNVEADERNPGNIPDDANAANAGDRLQNAGNAESNKTAITLAAAVGVNVVKHNTEATVSGIVCVTGDVEVSAENKNDMKTLGDASSVSAKTALSTGVSVVVNNSAAKATVTTGFADFEPEDTDSEEAESEEESGEEETEEEETPHEIGSISISADTRVNMGEDYTSAVAAQAIAGAGIGSHSGKLAVAGAVAVVSSNAKTQAVWTAPTVSLESEDDVSVTATEQSRLSARAWAGSLQNSLFNEEDKQTSSYSGSGAGLSCAWVRSNNVTEAKLLKADGAENINIISGFLKVEAKKLRVDSKNYAFKRPDLNGVLIIGSGLPSLDIWINTTEEPQDATNMLGLSDLLKYGEEAGINLLNYLASRNYYVEAVGGTALEDNINGMSCSGSFAIMDLTDTVLAEISDGFTVDAKNVNTNAASDATIVEIGGAVSYGGSNSVGATIGVVDNKTVVENKVGDIRIAGAEEVGFDSTNYLNLTGLTAAFATPDLSNGDRAGAGTIHVIVNKPTTKTDVRLTDINADTEGTLAVKTNVTADHKLNVLSISGGASKAGKVGAGGALSVTVSDADTEAIVNCAGNIRSKEVNVKADSNDILSQWTVSGTAVTGGWGFQLSPSINVNKEKTYAYLKGGNVESEKAGTVSVEANSNTKITNIAGVVALASSYSVGGAASWVVIDNDTQAILGSSVKGGSTVNVLANAKQTILGVAAGASASSQKSTGEGSLGVLYLTGSVLARVDDETKISEVSEKINVNAANDLDSIFVAGSLAASNRGNAVGLANSDILSTVNVKTEIGDKAEISGIQIEIGSKKTEDSWNWAFAGSAGFNGSLNGAVTTLNFEGDTKTTIGKNAKIESDGIGISAIRNTKIHDIACGFAFGMDLGAIGAGVDVVNVKGDTGVYLQDEASVITYFEGIRLDAKNNQDVTSFAAGGSGSTTIAGGLSVSMVDLQGTTEVVAGKNTVLQTEGVLAMGAADTRDLTQVAGRGDFSGSAALGAGAVSVTDTAVVRVKTDETSTLSAGDKSSANFYTGKMVKPKDGKMYAETAD